MNQTFRQDVGLGAGYSFGGTDTGLVIISESVGGYRYLILMHSHGSSPGSLRHGTMLHVKTPFTPPVSCEG